MGDLASLQSWDFFDVLHVHTVELATEEDVERVVQRAGDEGKRLVFTVHDLVPNIEADRTAFERKTALLGRLATSVATLTKRAASDLAYRLELSESAIRVVPHGAALPLPMIGNSRIGDGIAVFGALRPNRDFVAVARAWWLLSEPRPPLRMLVRSLSERDRWRYEPLLAELLSLERVEPNFTITTSEALLKPGELSSWCRQSSLLVLPYRRITHSGQLELARDIGMRVLAPDVATLHEQIAGDRSYPVVWFPEAALDEARQLAGYLQDTLSLESPKRDGSRWRTCRSAEHRRLIHRHYEVYYGSSSEGRVTFNA